MIIKSHKKKIIKDKKKYFFFIDFFKKNLIWILTILIFFTLGIWTERYELDRKIPMILNDSSSKLSSNFYSTFYHSEKMIIDINFKNYLKLIESRRNYLNNWKATRELRVKVPAKISIENKKTYRADISIKGTHKDHWEHPEKWSLKVNMKNNTEIFGTSEFAIHHPQTRGYLYEWLFMKFLKNENLIHHRVKFLEVIVNGNSLGLYNFTEAHTENLLLNNNKKSGPIVFYDKNQWVKETSSAFNFTSQQYKDSYLRSKLNLVNKSTLIDNPQLTNLTNHAFNLLKDFRTNKLSVREVFEINQLAKIFAIKAIFGAVEFDWKDIKFYLNPNTLKLEPIGREVHVDINNLNYESKTWWMSLSDDNFAHSVDQKYFLELFFKDKDFMQVYLFELKRIANIDYLQRVLEFNKVEIEKEKQLLNRYYPNIKVFSEEKLRKQIEFIQKSIKSIKKNNIYFSKKIKKYYLMKKFNKSIL